jgi:ATP-dependent helicase HrpA
LCDCCDGCRRLKISYPEELPVSRQRAVIREAVEHHQVVIVCGDTGSGKTTQLPKIALELGRGQKGKRIGCTQPRRIAATSVAKRVADELKVELGQEVGYQVRFDDRTNRERTAVKFMTDGILLAETQGDPWLRNYDTLIIDEAHERSLNIDFILGYLHRLLPERPELKVIVSSATLDAETFADFFRGAPVLQVEGRTFPVEDVYHPPLHGREPIAEQVARSAEWLASLDPLGDTLVFLPGEREIRDCADLLQGRRYPGTTVLPLFARQAGNEQQAVFQPMASKRRIILATNVAETSLTIPDIRSVIDSGIARMNRYDPVAGIQRLQIEEVSKASARQRRGRCGRVSDGICVRLYDEENFEDRSDYTDPEILRSNLAGVVLQMEHLGLGDPLKFPFIDRPQPKRISEAYRTLEEIDAIRKKGKHTELTEIGHALARLPLDPRVGRILVAGSEEKCLREALIVASAVTVQDPRERPQDKQQQADQAHALFRDKHSDFTGWLRLWHAIESTRRGSNNSLRRFCQKNFVNYRRTQEWLNLHRELRDVLRQLRWEMPDVKKPLSDPKDTFSEPLHRAILAGIPSHIGMHQGKKMGYKGASNRTFFLFPGSGVFGSAPAWVMAFEMVETAKLYARNIAMIDPAMFEKVAPHLCRYRYTKPHWVAEMGGVYGEEAVLAFGLPLVEKRRIHFGRIDPKVARDIFILEALVNGETRSPLPALKNNRETMRAAERLEHKLRRLGGMVHPEAVISFYQECVPEGMCTQKAFEKWSSTQPPGTLDLALEDCIVPQVDPIEIGDYPDEITAPDGETRYPLKYQHAPTNDEDGITMVVPLGDLPHLPAWFGDWLVPGWLKEKIAVLFRVLDKNLRTLLPSNREVVENFLDLWQNRLPDRPLIDAALEYLQLEHGIRTSADAFDLQRVPSHLTMRFEVLDDHHKMVGSGRDLTLLQSRLAGHIEARFDVLKEKQPVERKQITDWSIGDLSGSVPLDKHTVGFPGLHDCSDGTVALRLWPDETCALTQHRLGVARLFRLIEGTRIAQLEKVLFSPSAKALAKPMPRPTRTIQKPSPKKSSGGDGFGSLANAFGGAGSPAVSTPSPSTPPPAVVAKKDVSDSPPAPPVLVNLSPHQLLLLGNMGREPRRNRDDLLTLIVMEGLGEPRTESEWMQARANASHSLFEIAGQCSARLAKILELAEAITTMLDQCEAHYDESVADARDHLDQLLTPGWLLAGKLKQRITDLQGLELRITRMKGSPAAKDLAKLDRYRDAAATIWADRVDCACKQCHPPRQHQELLEQDFDARLKEFAQELRGRVRR